MKRFERVRMLLVEAENTKDTGVSVLLTEKAREIFDIDSAPWTPWTMLFSGLMVGLLLGAAMVVGG